MRLARFTLNLIRAAGTGILNILAGLLLLAVIVGSLIGILSLLGTATYAVFPDLWANPRPQAFGDRVAAGMLPVIAGALVTLVCYVSCILTGLVRRIWKEAA